MSLSSHPVKPRRSLLRLEQLIIFWSHSIGFFGINEWPMQYSISSYEQPSERLLEANLVAHVREDYYSVKEERKGGGKLQ
jgi:hypothetical protein